MAKKARRNKTLGKKTGRPKTSPRKSAGKNRTSRDPIIGGTSQVARKARKDVRRQEGLAKAGQSGSMQELSSTALADSESVEELLEEGQAFEAEVVSGVERTPETGGGEVHAKEVPEDDIPAEYRNPQERE